MEEIAKFTDAAVRPYEWLKEWKKTHDKKLIGVSPMHFPEEMVHAAGMQPVVLQESDEPVTFGHSFIYPNFCALLITCSKINFVSPMNLSPLGA